MRKILVLAMAISGADPGGWQMAKWGMSEVRIAEECHATPAHEKFTDKLTANLEIKAIQIGQVDFHVYFVVDPKDGLQSVRMNTSRADANEVTFTAVENLLVQKY